MSDEQRTVWLAIGLRGTSVGISAPAPRRSPSSPGTCRAEGCSTIVSIYNPKPYCWVHHPKRFLR